MKTKQEQIEEMAKTSCVACAPHNCCPILDKFRPCDAALEYAEAVYDEGYRKVDEVRKETAKEILNDLYFNLKSSVQDKVAKSNDYYNVAGWVEEIAKEYGVEVEE